MKVTVVAADEQEAMRRATDKKALDSVEFTACRAFPVSAQFAPHVWIVEGYHRIAAPVAEPEHTEPRPQPEQLTLTEIGMGIVINPDDYAEDETPTATASVYAPAPAPANVDWFPDAEDEYEQPDPDDFYDFGSSVDMHDILDFLDACQGSINDGHRLTGPTLEAYERDSALIADLKDNGITVTNEYLGIKSNNYLDLIPNDEVTDYLIENEYVTVCEHYCDIHDEVDGYAEASDYMRNYMNNVYWGGYTYWFTA